MKLSILIGEEFWIGLKAFRWRSKMKTNQIVTLFAWHHFKGKTNSSGWKKELQGELMGKLGSKVHCSCFFVFFTIFFQILWEWKTCYALRTLMRAHQLSHFWPILKLTRLVFVNFHRMAPIKKPIFTHSKWTKWRRIIIFQSCPRATHYNATTCTITLCMAIVEKKSHQYLVPMLIQCV
jgi:hypothetical protein